MEDDWVCIGAESESKSKSADESSLASNDLWVLMERLELADLHGDLHKEIQNLRDKLREIENACSRICRLSSQSPEEAKKVDGDKRFLELALKIMAMTRDDQIERTKNENLKEQSGEQLDKLCSQYQVPVSGDPTVGMEVEDSSDWHEDLHEEIELMREMLLAEINQSYSHVCGLWSEVASRINSSVFSSVGMSFLLQTPEPALAEEKRFLELALEFLNLTRNDKIKWSKSECFDTVRRIKSHVLHFRYMNYEDQLAKQLQQPGCQHQTPDKDKEGHAFHVSTEPPSLKKWPRLARQHYQMYKEFQSLKEIYLPIMHTATGYYAKLFQSEKKYCALGYDFLSCTTFLRLCRYDLLLISRDEFDCYARTIKILVHGVDTPESLYNNNISGDASNPIGPMECLSDNEFEAESADTPLSASSIPNFLFERTESADYHEDLHRELELMRNTELPDLEKFYLRLKEKCSQSPEAAAELEEEKAILEEALAMFTVPRDHKFEVSKKGGFVMLKFIRLFALRSMNEHLVEQSGQHLPTNINQLQLKPSLVFASVPVERVELVDWHKNAYREIGWARRKYLFEIAEDRRRFDKILSETPESTSPAIFGGQLFLDLALKLLMVSRKDKILGPKDQCFEILKRSKIYALRLRCRNSTCARRPLQHHLQATVGKRKLRPIT